MPKVIHAMYFSPTGTTQKVVQGLAGALAEKITGSPGAVTDIDFTLPQGRDQAVSFTDQDLVVFGVPVYAGRVPNILLKYLGTVKGHGARAVAVVVYGNRHYDDAAVELQDILEQNGFRVLAAGAFIGEHSFSKTLGQARPDARDMAVVAEFTGQIQRKISLGDNTAVFVPGSRPYRPYYKPRDENGDPVDFRKITPKTSVDCIDCKTCVAVCPMGSIDAEDVAKLNGICIKCCACVKKCPVQAKFFDDPNYIRHKVELELEFARRREPELFLSPASR